MLDSWLLNNLKTDPYDEVVIDWNWSVTDFSTVEKGKAKVKKEIARIFASPTLYRESEEEMGQLFVTILRQNRHQLAKQLDWRVGRTRELDDIKGGGCLVFNNPHELASGTEKNMFEKGEHVCQRGNVYTIFNGDIAR